MSMYRQYNFSDTLAPLFSNPDVLTLTFTDDTSFVSEKNIKATFVAYRGVKMNCRIDRSVMAVNMSTTQLNTLSSYSPAFTLIIIINKLCPHTQRVHVHYKC